MTGGAQGALWLALGAARVVAYEGEDGGWLVQSLGGGGSAVLAWVPSLEAALALLDGLAEQGAEAVV